MAFRILHGTPLHREATVIQRIRRFEPLQVAKLMAVLYTIMGLVLVPVFLLVNLAAPTGQKLPLAFAIAVPLIYGAIGFVFTGLAAALYNLVAGWVGGIEIELEAPPA
jgi:hypothetical protein